jgi:hypothetical protein
MSVVEDNTMNI